MITIAFKCTLFVSIAYMNKSVDDVIYTWQLSTNEFAFFNTNIFGLALFVTFFLLIEFHSDTYEKEKNQRIRLLWIYFQCKAIYVWSIPKSVVRLRTKSTTNKTTMKWKRNDRRREKKLFNKILYHLNYISQTEREKESTAIVKEYRWKKKIK